jgi:hypothetical protein
MKRRWPASWYMPRRLTWVRERWQWSYGVQWWMQGLRGAVHEQYKDHRTKLGMPMRGCKLNVLEIHSREDHILFEGAGSE